MQHGAGASPDEARLLSCHLSGTCVLPHLRGHGPARVDDGRFGWESLASDLSSVADEVWASRVLGVSVGAGALARVLAEEPDRFEAVVFFAPAVLDHVPPDRVREARERVTELCRAVEAHDSDALVELLARDVPPAVRDWPQTQRALRVRAESMLGSQVAQALEALVGTAPLVSPDTLRGVRARATVVTQAGDPLHTVGVAEAYAAALPDARLVVFGEDEPLWDSSEKLGEVLREALA